MLRAVTAVLLLAATGAGTAGSVSFTSSQAATGQKQYATSCAQCHGEQLEGGAGPALTGANFKTLGTKVGAHVGDIFTYMSTNMPLNDPASLPRSAYVNIMAFILSKNGYKPGKKALTYAQAESSKAKIINER